MGLNFRKGVEGMLATALTGAAGTAPILVTWKLFASVSPLSAVVCILRYTHDRTSPPVCEEILLLT